MTLVARTRPAIQRIGNSRNALGKPSFNPPSGSNIFYHITAFFVLMPYVGYGGIPTDTQPIAGILALLAIAGMTVRGSLVLDKPSAVVLAALLFAILGVAFGVPWVERDLFFDARALYGYLTSFIILVFFSNYLRMCSQRGVTRVADVAVALTFFGFLLNLAGLTWIIQIFVSRAEFEAFFDQARGLTSFYPEQSRLANQMIYLLAIYFAASSLNWLRIALVVLLGALSASGQFFVNFTVLAIFFLVASMLSGGHSSGIRLRMVSISFLTSIVLCGVAYQIYYNADYLVELGLPIRGVYAFREILQVNFFGLGRDLGFLFKVSGPLQAIAATWTTPFSIELGQAFYFTSYPPYVQAYENIMQVLFNAPLVPYPERSYSVFGAWVTDFKTFGLILFSTLFFLLSKSLYLSTRSSKVLIWALLSTTCFLFFTRSNVSEATLWATLASIRFASGLSGPAVRRSEPLYGLLTKPPVSRRHSQGGTFRSADRPMTKC